MGILYTHPKIGAMTSQVVVEGQPTLKVTKLQIYRASTEAAGA